MNGCMGTGKPLISILMAVYEPRLDWLREQLLSLNAQTYPNLRLYIRDDCSPIVPYDTICACVEACITAFPYSIVRNEKNIGSNGTFERLTVEAEGVYFAYCDQDDVWLPEKLKTLENGISTQPNCLLICSDMYIIDGNGTQVADSITKIRRHHMFRSGTNLAPKLLFSNFVTGCTMLVDAQAAKAAVPFCPGYVHDQYLALWCAERGELLSLVQPLIRYRIHGSNQTVMMAGITDKKSYCEMRIELALKRLRWMDAHFPCSGETKLVIRDGVEWVAARRRNWNHHGGIRTIWKYRAFSPLTSLFELVASWLPERVFLFLIYLKKKNVL